jgi:hypothetical protein
MTTNGSRYELFLDLKELCIKLASLEKRGELDFVVIRKVNGVIQDWNPGSKPADSIARKGRKK